MIKTDFLKLCSRLSLALLLGIAWSNSAIANEDEYYNFPTGNHEGGGVRGQMTGCATEASNPVPLASKDIQTTVSESPKLLFHVPDVIQASTLEIILLNQDSEIVYRDEFDPGYQPGIVSVDLVDHSNNRVLKIDSPYHWYLVQECEGETTPKIVAYGSLKRIELEQDLADKLDNASQLEKVKLYQSADIRHEAIANLVQLKCNVVAETKAAQKWMQVEKIDNITSLFYQSFDNYCGENLEAKSTLLQ